MNQDKIWEYYQNIDDSNLSCPDYGRIDFAIRKISNGCTALNIGVGRGAFEKKAIQKGINIYSLDPSAESINRLRERFFMSENNAKTGYSQSIPFDDNFFNVVVMTEVLEHLDDDILEKTIKEVYRVLKPFGRFIGTVPAEENLKLSSVVCPSCGLVFHRWGHIQSFERGSLVSLLSKDFKVSVDRVYFYSPSHLNWKGKISGAFKWIQAFFGLSGNGQNFFFSAEKI